MRTPVVLTRIQYNKTKLRDDLLLNLTCSIYCQWLLPFSVHKNDSIGMNQLSSLPMFRDSLDLVSVVCAKLKLFCERNIG